MNDLESYFYANPGRATLKWLHYFEIYDRHFARFRGTDVTMHYYDSVLVVEKRPRTTPHQRATGRAAF